MTTSLADRHLSDRLAERAAADAAHAVARAPREETGRGPAFALATLWDFVTGDAAQMPPHLAAWLADPARRALVTAMLAARAVARSGPLKAASSGQPLRRHIGPAVAELRDGSGAIPPLLVVTGLGDRAVSFAIVVAGQEIHRIALPPPVDGRTQTFLPPAIPSAARFAALFGNAEADILLL